MIDKGRGSPICWISGPGGSGKTTLAASYIEQRSLPSIWYRLDQGDSDIATFFYYLSLAAKKAAPRKKRPLPLLTPEYLGGIPVFSRRFFEDLCSRLTSSRSSSLPKKGMGGVIVLDNYQDVPPESEFHDVLLNGLKAVPYGMTVFILSREDPPVQFSEMGANNELFFIGWEEIRLTLDETVELVELRRAGLPKKLMRVLHEKVGGCTAGLLLALERIGQGAALPETFEQCAKEATFGYFAEEIFRRAEPSYAGLSAKDCAFAGHYDVYGKGPYR